MEFHLAFEKIIRTDEIIEILPKLWQRNPALGR